VPSSGSMPWSRSTPRRRSSSRRTAGSRGLGRSRVREGAPLPTPPRGQSPAFPDDAIGLVVLPVPVHAFPPGQLVPFRAGAGLSPALACRRRALEAVEKVVTGIAPPSCQAPLDM
jgi:hypothetical protein